MPDPLTVYAGFQAVGSLFGSRSKRKARKRAMREAARRYGVKSANVTHNITRRLALASKQFKSIYESGQDAQLVLQKNKAKAEAFLRVNAAASGVAGQNVDTNLTQVEQNFQNSKYAVRKNMDTQRQQLELSLLDDVMNIESGRGELVNNYKKQSTGSMLLEAGLAFGGAYALGKIK